MSGRPGAIARFLQQAGDQLLYAPDNVPPEESHTLCTCAHCLGCVHGEAGCILSWCDCPTPGTLSPFWQYMARALETSATGPVPPGTPVEVPHAVYSIADCQGAAWAGLDARPPWAAPGTYALEGWDGAPVDALIA